MIHLDTHVLVWLRTQDAVRLGAAARERLEGATLFMSPMAELELDFLHEIRRTRSPGAVVVRELTERLGLRVSSAPFTDVARAAATLSWTRDPFDRLIAAASVVDGVPLMTKNVNILKNVPSAFWP